MVNTAKKRKNEEEERVKEPKKKERKPNKTVYLWKEELYHISPCVGKQGLQSPVRNQA